MVGSETKRQARRRILQSDKFFRRGFKETKEAAAVTMNSSYNAEIMEELKANDYTLQRGDITFKLAKKYGFCWGVERAVTLAFEGRLKYPDRRIWITNEIIHNPMVNQQMLDAGILFVPQDGLKKDFSGVTGEDIVILPAFGATLEEMQYLTATAYAVVDTTCPWVSKVWHTLDRHSKLNGTSIIHGKYRHEETIATASFGEKYLIVLNMAEAQYVSDYILNGGDKAEFMEKFKNTMSPGLDPDTDLRSIGVANQTTMLKSETTAIGKLFEKTMVRLHGPAEFSKHFMASDTICDATQERQDAMEEVLQDKDIDLMLVVGGFNSSNTHHLQEMAEVRGVPSYWIDSPERIGPGNRIWSLSGHFVEGEHLNWLPKGPITIGITAGASTPEVVVGDALERISLIHKLDA